MTQHLNPIEFEVPGLEECLACWHYRGDVVGLVRRLKYDKATSLVGELADAIAAIAPITAVISWVPATPSRLRRRGFDQSELLARAVARRSGVRAARLLRRVDNAAQTSRDLAGRRVGPHLRYVGRRRHGGSSVLLIDDVSTTGSTLAAAGAVLCMAGHSRVSATVVAKVVSKGATH